MLEIRKASPNIGAEVVGIDVRQLSDADFARIYQVFLDHIVVVIRAQELTIEDYLAYSARLGRIKPHIVKRHRHPDYPDLMLMDNKVADTRTTEQTISSARLGTRGDVWHTDLAYEDRPAKATQLYSRIIPDVGGDTLFSSCYASYEALPAKLKARIQNLKASYRYGGRERRLVELLEDEDRNRPPAVHPLVRVHPETKRPSLYFDTSKILDILDVAPAESEDLIADLKDRMIVPGHQHRHQWQVGDIVVWDNRCALHRGAGGYPPEQRRSMWRVTIMEHDGQERRMSA